jgi:hypothetical protein
MLKHILYVYIFFISNCDNRAISIIIFDIMYILIYGTFDQDFLVYFD